MFVAGFGLLVLLDGVSVFQNDALVQLIAIAAVAVGCVRLISLVSLI